MTSLVTYNIRPPVAGDTYVSLLTLLAPLSESFGLMVGMSLDVLDARAREVLEKLGGHLLEAQETQSWPGSQIVGRLTSDRYLFRLDAESLKVLILSAESLYQWVNPMLPEDLHFLRRDGSVVLGMVAQEDDAWLMLSAEEYEEVGERLPADLILQRGESA